MYSYGTTPGTIIRTSDGAAIPAVSGNADYADCLAWVAQGNTISPHVESVAALKHEMSTRIDTAAEAARLRYITPGSGMAMVYQEKFAQAQAIAAMGEAAANALNQTDRESQFPTLSASISLEGATLWDCAQLVLTKYAQFAALSMHIERSRLAGKAAIKAATTVDGVRAAYAAVTWPTP